jgi:hypothetical protein
MKSMKKLVLLLAMFISVVSFARTEIPSWDKPLIPIESKKSMLVEPNVIGFGVDPVTINGVRKMHIWVQWDGYITTTWLWEFDHAGYWKEYGGGWGVKNFHLYMYSGNRYDYYYTLTSQDNPTWSWWNDIYFAPLQP